MLELQRFSGIWGKVSFQIVPEDVPSEEAQDFQNTAIRL